MSVNVWRRAVSITDSSRCCYWQEIVGLPYLLRLEHMAASIPVGRILIVDAKTALFEDFELKDFEERWVDEEFCTRNPKAMQTLALIPKSYDDWVSTWNGDSQEGKQ